MAMQNNAIKDTTFIGPAAFLLLLILGNIFEKTNNQASSKEIIGVYVDRKNGIPFYEF